MKMARVKPQSEHIALFRNLFVNRDDLYPVQYSPEPGESKYTVKREELTDEIITKHLRGELTIGLYSSKESTTNWAAVDFGDRNTDPVREAQKKAQHQNIPVYTEDSGRRGWHLWLFFRHSIPNATARKLAASLVPAGIEMFPKQDRIRNGPTRHFPPIRNQGGKWGLVLG